MLSLAVAMGIGRFAFTPLLPMMLHDGLIDLKTGSWLATLNYLGYWLGAIACVLQPWIWRRFFTQNHFGRTKAIRLGLGVTVLLTFAMCLNWPFGWAVFRLVAGVASALVFVYTSSWCLAQLATTGTPQLGGIIYVGPGLGIFVSGLSASAMVAQHASSAQAWFVFGVLAFAMTWLIWKKFNEAPTPTVKPETAVAQPVPAHNGHLWVLVLAYGLAGFGYIISATFLPVIARQTLPGSVWLDLFWPLFGLAVGAGALLTTRLPTHWDRRLLLIVCYLMQATGVMLAVWWPSLPGFALGSLLLGLPFTAISLFAMQEVRRTRPHDASTTMGLLTAAYGLGQIAGPALVAVILQRNPDPVAGFDLSLEIASMALVAGMALFAWLVSKR